MPSTTGGFLRKVGLNVGFACSVCSWVQVLTGRVADDEREGVGLASGQGVSAAGGQAGRGRECDGGGDSGGYTAGIDESGEHGGGLNGAAGACARLECDR